MSNAVNDIEFQTEIIEENSKQLKELSSKLEETVKRHENEISELKRQLVRQLFICILNTYYIL